MHNFEATEQQQDIINYNDGNLLVLAVPGAGKTQVIVRRFIRLVQQYSGEKNAQGVALLSFTNAAIDEMRSRIEGESDTTIPSNYFGTFDGFIRAFLALPLIRTDYSREPSIIASWKDLGTQFERCATVGKDPVYLHEFDFEKGAMSSKARTAYKYRQMTDQVEKSLVEKAIALRDKYISEGCFDNNSIRMLITQILKQDNYEQFKLIATRFREIIVDEVQDCDDLEIELLRRLHNHGVTLTLVGDLDQEIFGFRGANAKALWQFCTEKTSEFEIKQLDINFRSSPLICQFITTLRNMRKDKDMEEVTQIIDNPYRTEPTTRLQLLPFDSLSKLGKLLTAQQPHGIAGQSANNLMVLCSTNDSVSKIRTGTKRTYSFNTQPYSNLLDPIKQYTLLERSGNRYKSARSSLASAIRADFLDTDNNQFSSMTELKNYLERRNYSIDRVGITLYSTIANLLEQDDLNTIELQRKIQETLRDMGLNSKQTLSLPEPALLRQYFTRIEPQVDGLSFSTIHASKGRQFPHVVLLFTNEGNGKYLADNFFDMRCPDKFETSRKLIYVAASRAEDLLVLAVQNPYVEKMQEFLNRSNIDYDLLSHKMTTS